MTALPDHRRRIPFTSIEDKCSLWHSLRKGFVNGSKASRKAVVEEVSTDINSASTTSLTHGQLYHAACSLASSLQSRCNVFTGDRVMLVLDNSPSVLVVLFAVAACGGVAVSCDTKSTVSEFTEAIFDVGAKLIVCDERHAPTVERAS